MTPYLAPSQSPLSAAPLSWTLLATVGRRAPATADVEVLARVAADPTLDLTQTHAGWSVLAAALLGWGSGQIQTLRTAHPQPLLDAAVPGEPARPLPVNAPETAALILLHRGLDPFEHWDQVTSGETPLTLTPAWQHQDLETMKCPFGLALRMGLDSVVAASLRVAQAPSAEQLDALTLDSQPLLHVLLEQRPRLLAPLLAHGLDANRRDAQERTPLFMARTVEQVNQLCRAGADPSALDRQGRAIEQWWQSQQVPHATALTRALTAARDQQNVAAPVLSGHAAVALKGPFLIPGLLCGA